MSVLTYIASDLQIQEVENTHVRQLSINEALQLGIKVADFLLEDAVDKDEPNVILWVENEDSFGEISIRRFKSNDIYDEIYTDKKNLAYLDWEYSDARAEKLITYIKKHLQKGGEIELNRVWLGSWGEDMKNMKTYKIPSNELVYLDFEKVFKNKPFKYPEKIIIF